jgi:uncharacterized membrane protein YgaE (UPF0421/DUF939 family)
LRDKISQTLLLFSIDCSHFLFCSFLYTKDVDIIQEQLEQRHQANKTSHHLIDLYCEREGFYERGQKATEEYKENCKIISVSNQ